MWVRWLFWQDVVLPGVECWVAYLLEAGHILQAEVLVYTRAFDDAIDALLMRSKAEAVRRRSHKSPPALRARAHSHAATQPRSHAATQPQRCTASRRSSSG